MENKKLKLKIKKINILELQTTGSIKGGSDDTKCYSRLNPCTQAAECPFSWESCPSCNNTCGCPIIQGPSCGTICEHCC